MESDNLLEALSANVDYASELYDRYTQDPNHVPDEWKTIFQQLGAPAINSAKPQIQEAAPLPSGGSVLYYPKVEIVSSGDQRVCSLIEAYRTYGHLMAQINPIATHPPAEPFQLTIEASGFTKQDLTSNFPTCGLLPEEEAPLLKILQTLKSIYSSKIGYEITGLQNPELEAWLQSKIENPQHREHLTIEQKKFILHYLNRSELFESFLNTKFTGQKRFSVEGGETLIPMLAFMIESGANLGMEEVVIGMAHRGRLNVLTNILNKSYSNVFFEFEEGYIPDSFEGSGDVKYHKGFNSQVTTASGQLVNIILSPNPSHLDAVDPVVEGMVRSKQFFKNEDRNSIVPVLIHGDAALSGQGVIYETLQMAKLPGYATGGTLHFVINNQIGFTTVPRDGRSTRYCTDIAKTFSVPVFHVNAEDPESCILVTSLAIQIRQKFQCDVFIDLNCYRKYGHNESDEPAFTQPLEYQIIRAKQPIREIYRDELIHQGVVEKKVAESLETEFTEALQQELETIKKNGAPKAPEKQAATSQTVDIFEKVETSVPEDILQVIADNITFVPQEFKAHKKLNSLQQERRNSLSKDPNEKTIDWGTAEIAAYASLVNDGVHVRISGQDVQRGTFSHRHAVLVHQEQEEEAYTPLKNIREGQGAFEIYNSPLSEFAVLGFEFGYSIASPEALTIWEAQFGDFCNGAQVIIDQFISTTQQKWGQNGPVTLFLPHGYEGQGPEHSSARMERFLILSGENNWRIAYPSTPAQMFHLLRSQAFMKARRPLIIFTPKGLLRHPQCLSSRKDLIEGAFLHFIEDFSPNAIKLIFCSGRVYYDLKAELEKAEVKDVALVRVELLYPLDTETLQAIINKHTELKSCAWVQEEPCNMGAWSFIHPQLVSLLPETVPLQYIGRARSASPAAGSYALHKRQHKQLIDELLHFLKE